jgi:CBS domain-containing protein
MIEAPVSEHMQRDPVTVPSSMLVADLAELFAAESLAFAPVVDDGRLVGVVSETDLVLQEAGADQLHVPHAVPFLGDLVYIEGRRRFEERFRRAFGTSVADLMDDEPVVVSPDATVHEAARLLVDRDVARLPVVDEGGTVIGTIGRSDVVRALAQSEF